MFLFLICCIVEMSDKEETVGEPPPSDTSLANNVARLKDLGTGHDEDYIKKVLRQTSNNVEVKSNLKNDKIIIDMFLSFFQMN